jgi:hypothetical protein
LLKLFLQGLLPVRPLNGNGHLRVFWG